MLEIRPNCELCDKDLLADATDACICSYECTFCETCVKEILENVCPNCSGGFTSRPIRPKTSRRSGVSIEHQPASTERIHTKHSVVEIKKFSLKTRHIKPEHR